MGKTTLLERLVPELTARGLVVSLIKHSHKNIDIDRPGKDSYRLRESGCKEVLLLGNDRWALMHELRGAPEPSLDYLLDRLQPCDLVLIEGFKHGDFPKLEVWRASVGKPTLAPDWPGIVAIASDAPLPTSVPAGLTQLDLADASSIAAFVLANAATRLARSAAAVSPYEPPDGAKLGLTPESIFTEALISSRQNILPRRLSEPGPSAAQVEQLFRAAACAPDHGELRPWRFVLVPASKRANLAEVFAQALLERDAQATAEQLAQAREKAHRAPLLMLVVACLGPREPAIPTLERMVSVGCAIQNILLTAHSMAFGAGLTSGQAMASPHMRSLFQLLAGEEAVCFLNVGTTSKRKAPRLRPDPVDFVTSL